MRVIYHYARQRESKQSRACGFFHIFHGLWAELIFKEYSILGYLWRDGYP